VKSRRVGAGPTGLESVLGAIARTAARVCEATDVLIHLVDGDRHRLVAKHGRLAHFQRLGDTHAIRRDTPLGLAVLDRRPVHVRDMATAVRTRFRGLAQLGLYNRRIRTILVMPLLEAGAARGGIVIRRTRVQPFTTKQMALLKAFADQAAIAIENARLSQDLEVRNRSLREALEQQTATAEIFRVISSLPTDLTPVFETIVQNAGRVCDVDNAVLHLIEGDDLVIVTRHGPARMKTGLPPRFPLTAGSVTGRAVLEKRPIQVGDLSEAADFPEGRQRALAGGSRTTLAVPLLREGVALGGLLVRRPEVRPFTDQQIALLQTFADQAVIAIENVRLFSELQERTAELRRSVEQLRALSEVGQAVSSTLDLDAVLQAIVSRAAQLAGTRGASIWEYDESAEVFHLRATNILDPQVAEILRASGIRKGEGAIGRAALTRAPVQIPDISAAGAYEGPLRDALLRAGGGSVLTLPLLNEDHLLGGLTVSRRATGEFPPDAVALLTAFAAQSAIALQNARLFRELEAKSRELEVASRHKSQFLANMSHELRTPLNAILGYGELMADGIYGELPEPVREVLGRVDRSGRHLLGLINDVLDLSKIEAGQLSLVLAEYSMKEIAEVVITSVQALAAEKGLALALDLAPDLPTGRGDQRRLTQVLLNLVGNAIKFTEQGGIGVQAVAANGAFEVTVIDTGPGIAPADQKRIFEEFQQASTSTTRPQGGTGLGLAIARRIVAMHGGRLWVESVVGEGSRFRFRLPVRVEQQVTAGVGERA
jgi:signal transduction histidine kinase